MKFPQNVRIISRSAIPNFTWSVRIILVLLIIAGFGMSLADEKGQSNRAKVRGVKSQEADYLRGEIEKVRKITLDQPGYADAWLKLSILYEQIGETDLSKAAFETAKRLNPDL